MTTYPMLMYDVVIDKSQYRKYLGFPHDAQESVKGVVDELRGLPQPSAHSKAEALSGPHSGLFRVRIGDYRLVCEKDMNELKIHKLGKRKEVYENMNKLYSEVDA